MIEKGLFLFGRGGDGYVLPLIFFCFFIFSRQKTPTS